VRVHELLGNGGASPLLERPGDRYESLLNNPDLPTNAQDFSCTARGGAGVDSSLDGRRRRRSWSPKTVTKTRRPSKSAREPLLNGFERFCWSAGLVTVFATRPPPPSEPSRERINARASSSRTREILSVWVGRSGLFTGFRSDPPGRSNRGDALRYREVRAARTVDGSRRTGFAPSHCRDRRSPPRDKRNIPTHRLPASTRSRPACERSGESLA